MYKYEYKRDFPIGTTSALQRLNQSFPSSVACPCQMPALATRSVWFPRKSCLHRRLPRTSWSFYTHLTSVPSNLIPRILLSNVLFVFSIYASKEWLLTYDVGVFWVLMRVLACGAFGVLLWEGFTGQSSKRKTYEVGDFFFLGACWLTFLVVGVGYRVFTAVRAICMLVHGTI